MNAKDNDGWTPLHLSADEGHLEGARLLIDNGADLNVRNNRDLTPLDLDSRLGDIIDNQRNVRRRIGGGAIDEDKVLSKAIQVLFSQIEDLSLRETLIKII